MDNKNNPLDTLNNPMLNTSGKPSQKAITSGEQAHGIARKLESDQSHRNNLEAEIDRRYNGALPLSHAQLQANEETWRNNFSTGFMSGIIGKVIPAPVGLVDGTRFLTSSQLSDANPEASKKSEMFRDKVTKTIREWDGWKDFQYSLWTEVVLHGNAIVACLDPYSPWPEMYRTDQAFVPIGTGQNASMVPFFSAKKDYMVHEFVELIKDRESADDAGWDTEAAIEAVDNALPKTRSNAEQAQARSYEDAIREGNPGASYSGAAIIQTDHVLAVEPDTKKVTHYIVDRNGNHKVLFQKDDRFNEMCEVLSLFTLEPGNGTFYGSKGLGRLLLNMHIACEANRNLLLDQLRLAGMVIFKTDGTKGPTIQMKVRHPILILSGEGELQQQQLSPNVNDFILADNQLARWAEQRAGAYISDLLGDDNQSNTATEETIRAKREQQFRIAFLARAWGQHSSMISLIQKRLADPETTDKAAKKFQKELIDAGLSREELTELAESATAEVIQDMTDAQNAKITAAFQMLSGNPQIDQHKLLDQSISAMVSPQFTRDILLDPQGEQANEIEAYRQQMGENEDMINGQSIPVSPRDPHEFHLKAVLGELQKGIPSLAQDPTKLDSFNMALAHAQAHVDQWSQQGASVEQARPFVEAIKLFDKALQAVAKGHMDARQAPNGAQGAQPASPQGQQATGQPAAPTGPSVDEMTIKAAIAIYDKAPASVQAQVEAALGFKPASPEERAAWDGDNHPGMTIPAQVGATRMTQAALPGASIPTPPEPPPEDPSGLT